VTEAFARELGIDADPEVADIVNTARSVTDAPEYPDYRPVAFPSQLQGPQVERQVKTEHALITKYLLASFRKMASQFSPQLYLQDMRINI
jgi:hypothetical protein